MFRCDICRMKLEDKEKLDRKLHGWPIPTGTFDPETGAAIWKARLCADASPQEILTYRKLKQDIDNGIISRGMPGDK